MIFWTMQVLNVARSTSLTFWAGATESTWRRKAPRFFHTRSISSSRRQGMCMRHWDGRRKGTLPLMKNCTATNCPNQIPKSCTIPLSSADLAAMSSMWCGLMERNARYSRATLKNLNRKMMTRIIR